MSSLFQPRMATKFGRQHHAMMPALPVELFDSIAMHLSDDIQSLKAYSLVSHFFVISARPHLFRTVKIFLPQTPEAYSQELQLPKSATQRVLDKWRLPSTQSQSPSYLAMFPPYLRHYVEKVFLDFQAAKGFSHHSEQVATLSSFPSLRAIHIAGADLRRDWTYPSIYTTLVAHLLAPTLREVGFIGCRMFLSKFQLPLGPSVDSVIFHTTFVEDGSIPYPVPAEQRLTLRSLTLRSDFPCDSMPQIIPKILPGVSSRFDIAKLQHLTVPCWDELVGRVALSTVLEQCAETLRELTLIDEGRIDLLDLSALCSLQRLTLSHGVVAHWRLNWHMWWPEAVLTTHATEIALFLKRIVPSPPADELGRQKLEEVFLSKPACRVTISTTVDRRRLHHGCVRSDYI